VAEETSIHVNFGKPFPVFALDSVALMPQQVLPLHIFEPRYKQMVEQSIDGAGQFAVGVFKGERWKQEYHGTPPIRPIVCLAQIFEHQKQADGRYYVLVRGVCRARITRELRPAPPERLYRQALLEPIGLAPDDETRLYGVRERLNELLSDGPLTQLTAAKWVAERLRDDEIPATALLELVSFTMVSDTEIKYSLLAEPDAAVRAEAVEKELLRLGRLIEMAESQHPETWPKGMSWN
jgi:uncharacterized protein